jgi:hypothetical protein
MFREQSSYVTNEVTSSNQEVLDDAASNEKHASVSSYMKTIVQAEFPLDSDDTDDDFVPNDKSNLRLDDVESISDDDDDESDLLERDANRNELQHLYTHAKLTDKVSLSRERKVRTIKSNDDKTRATSVSRC